MIFGGEYVRNGTFWAKCRVVGRYCAIHGRAKVRVMRLVLRYTMRVKGIGMPMARVDVNLIPGQDLEKDEFGGWGAGARAVSRPGGHYVIRGSSWSNVADLELTHGSCSVWNLAWRFRADTYPAVMTQPLCRVIGRLPDAWMGIE